jgi:hypothetical protein
VITAQRERKRHIRAFFVHYTDEKLCALLAHARDGKLDFPSCCCFIGVATADHALRSWEETSDFYKQEHFIRARSLPGASDAEHAYFSLSPNSFEDAGEKQRRRILVPMIRAEMKIRQWQRELDECLDAGCSVNGKDSGLSPTLTSAWADVLAAD